MPLNILRRTFKTLGKFYLQASEFHKTSSLLKDELKSVSASYYNEAERNKCIEEARRILQNSEHQLNRVRNQEGHPRKHIADGRAKTYSEFKYNRDASSKTIVSAFKDEAIQDEMLCAILSHECAKQAIEMLKKQGRGIARIVFPIKKVLKNDHRLKTFENGVSGPDGEVNECELWFGFYRNTANPNAEFVHILTFFPKTDKSSFCFIEIQDDDGYTTHKSEVKVDAVKKP